jgi:naphthalene 1,2-dioxygenase ferredoxin component
MSSWVKVAAASAIAEGEALGVEVQGRHIALYNVDGRFFATDNVCTHAFALLSDGYLDGNEIECPIHAGRFNVCTGKAMGAPVTTDLKIYPVRLEGDDLMVEIAS